MTKNEAKKFYYEFRELVGRNTEMCMKCLDKMNQDGYLIHLKDCNDLSLFEIKYIEKLLNDARE